jgi:acetyl-CoA carboxylase carboxyl transferase subunit beta
VDARALVARVLDPGSWTSWDVPLDDLAPPESAYARELAAARARTGHDEAVITGTGAIRGRGVALVVSEFGFLAGSIGVATAARIVAAVERATAEGLPLLAAPSSGGTRMQEGTVAFVQMARVAAAVTRHKAAGLPYLVYLRHPTTGGVLASWGSLGHMTVAEPGALIGFLGPRVYETLRGEPFPPDVQTAENLYAHGLIDAVVDAGQIGEVAARALGVISAPRTALTPALPLDTAPDDVPDDAREDAWESIGRSRREDRPGARELLRHGARDVTPLSGTGEGESDPGLLLALARFGSVPCVVVAHDRRGRRAGHPIGPAGLRVARRGMRLAAGLRLPLVTVVDTPGAVLSAEAEERGLAGEIARCLADLITLAAPTACVLLGEGTGGAALALLPADRVLCARHAWLCPLPPEGASAIVYRNVEHAAETARAQGVRSADLLRDGIVDLVVPERPDAADEPVAFCSRVAALLERELIGLLDLDDDTRAQARQNRYRRLGPS